MLVLRLRKTSSKGSTAPVLQAIVIGMAYVVSPGRAMSANTSNTHIATIAKLSHG